MTSMMMTGTTGNADYRMVAVRGKVALGVKLLGVAPVPKHGLTQVTVRVRSAWYKGDAAAVGGAQASIFGAGKNQSALTEAWPGLVPDHGKHDGDRASAVLTMAVSRMPWSPDFWKVVEDQLIPKLTDAVLGLSAEEYRVATYRSLRDFIQQGVEAATANFKDNSVGKPLKVTGLMKPAELAVKAKDPTFWTSLEVVASGGLVPVAKPEVIDAEYVPEGLAGDDLPEGFIGQPSNVVPLLGYQPKQGDLVPAGGLTADEQLADDLAGELLSTLAAEGEAAAAEAQPHEHELLDDLEDDGKVAVAEHDEA